MNKRAIVSRLIEKLSQNADLVGQAAEGARQASIASPGRNQTRYGTEKEEYGYLADGLNLRHMEIERGVIDLGGVPLPERPETVIQGSFVRVDEGNGAYSRYLILPYGGGESIEEDGEEIDIITPSSPIARAMIGKCAGDTFDFEVRGKTRSYRIKEIE